MRKETATKAEMIMMGSTQTVSSDEEVKDILTYIRNTLKSSHKIDFDPEQVLKDSVKYCKGHTYKAINIITFDDMILISLVMTTDEDLDDEFDLLDTSGVLAYVYNTTYPDLSELGYVYFQKRGPIIKRVG